jgi:SAM-dependent methyltransferase
MTDTLSSIAAHYGGSEIGARVLEALAAEGIDIDALTPEILAPIDQFHTRGLPATKAQMALSPPTADTRVLDLGCGVGGPARFLAATYGCRVTGIDLTEEYVSAAAMLTERCGLSHLADFRRGDAMDLPFPDAAFDMAISQNVTMNIADKPGFYAEACRVLRPGGIYSSTDAIAGPKAVDVPLVYPLPWAREPSISFLAPQNEMEAAMASAGFRIREWRDVTAEVVESVQSAGQQARRGKLGVGLIAGADFAERSANHIEGFASGALASVMIVAEKAG